MATTKTIKKPTLEYKLRVVAKPPLNPNHVAKIKKAMKYA